MYMTCVSFFILSLHNKSSQPNMIEKAMEWIHNFFTSKKIQFK